MGGVGNGLRIVFHRFGIPFHEKVWLYAPWSFLQRVFFSLRGFFEYWFLRMGYVHCGIMGGFYSVIYE